MAATAPAGPRVELERGIAAGNRRRGLRRRRRQRSPAQVGMEHDARRIDDGTKAGRAQLADDRLDAGHAGGLVGDRPTGPLLIEGSLHRKQDQRAAMNGDQALHVFVLEHLMDAGKGS